VTLWAWKTLVPGLFSGTTSTWNTGNASMAVLSKGVISHRSNTIYALICEHSSAGPVQLHGRERGGDAFRCYGTFRGDGPSRQAPLASLSPEQLTLRTCEPPPRLPLSDG
jgi:hypothetical protein